MSEDHTTLTGAILISYKNLIYMYVIPLLWTCQTYLDSSCCLLPFAKAGDIKTHSFVRLSLCLSVTKTLTWLISAEVLMIEH